MNPASLRLPGSGQGDAAVRLDAFLSPALRRMLGAGDALPDVPVVERFAGALLLVDVSGWTKLVHELSAAGPEGVERLTQALNAHLGRLLETIHAHGGTVEKFAGDALLALWRAADGQDHAGALERARACAAALVGDPPLLDETTQSLALHVGVAGGALAAVAGRAQEAQGFFLLCGEPLAALAAAAEAAAAGEAMLATPAGMQRIEPQPAAAPPRAPAALAALRLAAPLALQLIHPVIAARAAAAESDAWLAEMRQVSAVFVQLQLALDRLSDAELAERLAAAAREVHAAAQRFDGAVHDFLVDDKGVVGIVVFGALRTHEDDAARALRAAGQLVEALAARAIGATAGVASGRAYTGVVGNDLRRDFAVIGDPMNLAARLMLRAEDVLCDAATRERAPRLALSGGEAIALKGRAQELRVFRPQAGAAAPPPEAAAAPAALLGRRAEQARLARALEAHCAQPGPALVLIEGEAGIGKSTLLEHFARAALARGAGLWRAAGEAIESRSPYHAWRGAMREIVAALAGDAARADPTRGLSLLAERRPDWRAALPLVNDIAATALPDTPMSAQLSGEARRDAVARLVLALVGEAARDRPHCLVIEDAHWLDSPSAALLSALLRGGAPLLVVASTRPTAQEANEDLDALVAAASEHLRLGELSREATQALLASALGVRELAQGVVDFVIERAHGHPFFVEELARALLEGGLIRIEAGRCEPNRSGPGLQQAAVPDTLERLIVSRIDRLGEDDRLLLKVASVLGGAFELEDLHAVHPARIARERIGDQLSRLAARGLVQRAEGGRYAFHHAITREVSYGMMTLGQRRPLHRQVAEHLEARAGAALEPLLAVLAYHWRAAGVARRAIDYADRAGTQALEQAAMREAIQLLSDALAMDAEQPRPAEAATRARWLTGIGKAQRFLGHVPEARASLCDALRVLARPVPRAGALFQLEAMLRLAWAVLRGVDARAAQLATRASGALTAIDAYNHLAMLSYFENDTAGSVFCNAVSTPLAGEAGASLELAHLYGSLANAAGFMGLAGAARRFADQAHRVAQATGVELSEGVVNQYTGHLAACRGELAAFDARMHRALEIYDRLGQRRHWEEALINCAYLYQWRGETRRALEAVQRLEASARSRDDPQTLAWAVQGQARLLHLLGRDAEACELFARAEPLVEDDLSRLDLYAHWSRAELRAGRAAQAEQRLERFAAVLQRGSGPTYTKVSGLSAAAEAGLQLWRENPGPPAQRRLRATLGALKSLARLSPLGRARALLWSGTYAWHRGRARSARAQWRKALAAARAMELALDEALVQLWRATLDARARDAGALERAAAVFERAEYAWERERLAALQGIRSQQG